MSAVVSCNSMIDDNKVRSAVRRLTLVNFRNYKYLRLNFDSPFIILGGENGSGKTNVLEAVSFSVSVSSSSQGETGGTIRSLYFESSDSAAVSDWDLSRVPLTDIFMLNGTIVDG